MRVDTASHNPENGLRNLVVQATIYDDVDTVGRPALRIRLVCLVLEDLHRAHAGHAIADIGRNAGSGRGAQAKQARRISRAQLGGVLREAPGHARLQVGHGVPTVDLRDNPIEIAHCCALCRCLQTFSQARRAQACQLQASRPGKCRGHAPIGLNAYRCSIAGHIETTHRDGCNQAGKHLRQVGGRTGGVCVRHAVDRHLVDGVHQHARLQHQISGPARDNLYRAGQGPQILADAVANLRACLDLRPRGTIEHNVCPRLFVTVALHSRERHGAVQRHAGGRAGIHGQVDPLHLLPQVRLALGKRVYQEAGNAVRPSFHLATKAGSEHPGSQVSHDLLSDLRQARTDEPVRCDTVGHRYL
ncbi:hypothetical protein L543_1407 [Bordetella hinzii L60]|nr:hypothetical protein L543_1407 [Bordetella hinzii L60]